jgi:hypothetical protein
MNRSVEPQTTGSLTSPTGGTGATSFGTDPFHLNPHATIGHATAVLVDQATFEVETGKARLEVLAPSILATPFPHPRTSPVIFFIIH